ncbi:MAG: flavin reductase family protein [Lentisphaeria bacterium]|nr:flavin reductase family protein [Lentisphaeria bacterium]
MVQEKLCWPGSAQLAPVPAVLVGCGDGSRRNPYNLITVGWCGMACSDPPQLTIGVRPERFSFGLIRRTGEFTVNLPTKALTADLDYCGVVSGKAIDKFKERGLTPVPGDTVKAPLVGECPVALECRVKEALELGSHWLFIADILAVRVDPGLVDGNGKLDMEKAGLITYAHGNYYAVGEELGRFGFSVRKKQ